MCEPTTLALGSMAVGTASAVSRNKAQRQAAAAANANAQLQYQTALANRGLLMDQRARQMAHQAEATAAEKVRLGRELLGIQTGYIFRRDDRAIEKGETRLEAYQQQSAAQTVAGAAGVSGRSIDRILQGFDRAASKRVASLEEEARRDYVTTKLRADDARLGSLQRIIGINQPLDAVPHVAPPGHIEGPSSSAMWLDIASAGMGAADIYMRAGGTFGGDDSGTGVQLQTREPSVNITQV